MRYPLLVLLLAGCASTAVAPVSGDVLMATSSSALGQSSTAERSALAYQKAREHCSAAGKTIEPINEAERPTWWSLGTSTEVRFRCR